MDLKAKTRILESLLNAIKSLELNEMINVYRDGNYFAVHMEGVKNLPEGNIEYRIRHKEKVCDFPWEAVVRKNGIEYFALISYNDAWALYV